MSPEAAIGRCSSSCRWPLAFSTGHWIHPPRSAQVTQAAVVGASGERGSLLITFSPFRWLTGLVAIIESHAHGLAWLAFRLVWLNLSGRLFLMRTPLGSKGDSIEPWSDPHIHVWNGKAVDLSLEVHRTRPGAKSKFVLSVLRWLVCWCCIGVHAAYLSVMVGKSDGGHGKRD